jgi:hypothetical protein
MGAREEREDCLEDWPSKAQGSGWSHKTGVDWDSGATD